MAHIRGAPSHPALVVTGTGKAGHDGHRVVWEGEAHGNSVGPAAEPDVNRT
jgi:hypothetical protein